MDKTRRKPLIAGNWKMNGSADMARELVDALLGHLPIGSVEIMVIPPFPYLAQIRSRIAGNQLLLGAQNVSMHAGGAFTGEVSAGMLADVGVAGVLVGHSERRELCGEDDAQVAAKFEAVRRAGLKPVLCIGETLQQRDAGMAESRVGEQLDAVLERCGIEAFAGAAIAYEPVWAIGTGRVASASQAQQIHSFVRTRLANHDATIAGLVRILYGGSMKPENASSLLACPDIDGGLIGGASLNAGHFLEIASAAARA
ncbi:MAG: triose-phosphate isomerase [Xanthomonadaceae bacterium]|nr:triose-phosphate isomerase [Xanthomonadaceae bacterium]